uniref:WSC domain-containing protein n=1 Tax=Macrostomum lignano TaxID=282301 RepID=A0A1I8HB94_9PLAT
RQLNYYLIGCYVDDNGGVRDLSGFVGINSWSSYEVVAEHAQVYSVSMTRRYCRQVCGLGGFAYMGLQNAYSCYCGNKYGSQGAVALADCGKPCPGNGSETCGDMDRNLVFGLNYLVTASAAYGELAYPQIVATSAIDCISSCQTFGKDCQAVIYILPNQLCHLLKFALVPEALVGVTGQFYVRSSQVSVIALTDCRVKTARPVPEVRAEVRRMIQRAVLRQRQLLLLFVVNRVKVAAECFQMADTFTWSSRRADAVPASERLSKKLAFLRSERTSEVQPDKYISTPILLKSSTIFVSRRTPTASMKAQADRSKMMQKTFTVGSLSSSLSTEAGRSAESMEPMDSYDFEAHFLDALGVEHVSPKVHIAAGSSASLGCGFSAEVQAMDEADTNVLNQLMPKLTNPTKAIVTHHEEFPVAIYGRNFRSEQIAQLTADDVQRSAAGERAIQRIGHVGLEAIVPPRLPSSPAPPPADAVMAARSVSLSFDICLRRSLGMLAGFRFGWPAPPPPPPPPPPPGQATAMTDKDFRRPSVASLSELRNQLPDDLRQQQNSRQTASRPTYTEVQLEEVHQIKLDDDEKIRHKKQLMENRKAGPKEVRSKGAVALGILSKIFPVIKVFVNYKVKEYAVYDLLSGISVGMFIIPQAIAFSLLAQVKPQYGFYSAFFAMLIYFIFGTSNHLNMSVLAGVEQVHPNGAGICVEPNDTITTLGPNLNFTDLTTEMTTTLLTTTMDMIGINSTANPDMCIPRADANTLVSISITMVAGAVQLLLGLLQFGFLTIYLSDPLNSAFTCGAALHILSSQLANMLGTTLPPISGVGKFFVYFVEAFKQISAGNVNVASIIVCLVSFAVLLAVKIINEKCSKYVKIPIPIDIIVLVTSLLLSQFLNWETELDISTVGAIERGFRAPTAPPVEHFTSGTGIIINGLVLGIISYSLSVSVAKTFAVRYGYEVDSNQEMIAYGAVNFGMSWFSTFVSASSIACTSLHESMRGKTLCVLSAIILVNLKNMMMQVEQLPGLWRTNRYDFAIWLVTLAAILGIDLPIGLLVGVIFSLATVIFRSQAPKAYLLGRVPETDIYKNVKKIKGAEEIEGVRVFKFDGALYFASAENFRTRLFRQVAMNPKKILAKAKAHAKKTGALASNLDIRTEVMDKEEIKEQLEIVKAEGSHPDDRARQLAQASMDELNRSNNSQTDLDDYDDKDDVNGPVVNVFCIILDLSACAFTDAVGIRLLSQIVEDFNKIGVEIYLANCTSLVRSQLRKANFFAKRSEENGVFVTVHDAVLHALSTLYQELLEDENESESDFEARDHMETVPAPHLSHHHANKKLSTGSDEAARELRRQSRKVSRQQAMSAHSDDLSGGAALSSASSSSRRISQRAEHADRINEEREQQQQQTSTKNRYQPDEAKPLPVFDEARDAGQASTSSRGVADVLVHEDEESRREREEMDLNFAEMLKSLPDTDDDDAGEDNAGFQDSAL